MYVTIVFYLYIVIIRGDVLNGHTSTLNYTWGNATQACTMVNLQHVKKGSHFRGINCDLCWIDGSVTYSPWVQYLGCFKVRSSVATTTRSINTGKQLLTCLDICRDYAMIGLQHTQCMCLPNITISDTNIEYICRISATSVCLGDNHSICANSTDHNQFALYRKVNIDQQVEPRDCLGIIQPESGKYRFSAVSCLTKLHRVCRDFTGESLLRKLSWADSYLQCAPEIPVKYDVPAGFYWLPIVRKPTFESQSSSDNEYCPVVSVRNSSVYLSIEYCNRELPALCAETKRISTITSLRWTTEHFVTSKTSTEQSVTSRTSTEHFTTLRKPIQHSTTFCTSIETRQYSSTTQTTNRKTKSLDLVMIALVVVVAILIAGFVMFFIIRCRRRASQTLPRSTIQDANEVVYAQVNKQNNPEQQQRDNANQDDAQAVSDSLYDHMNHDRIENDNSKLENDYDTMQKIAKEEEYEDNDYDFSNGNNTDRRFVADNENYSHV